MLPQIAQAGTESGSGTGASAGYATYTIGSATAKPGDTNITIPIVLDSYFTNGYSTASMVVDYDHSALTFVSADPGPGLKNISTKAHGFGSNFHSSKDGIQFSRDEGTVSLPSSGELVTLTFSVSASASGEYEIGLTTDDFFKNDGWFIDNVSKKNNNVTPTIKKGKITVSGSSATTPSSPIETDKTLISIGSITGTPGTKVSVPVNISGNTGFAGFGAGVKAGVDYDSSVFKFDSYTAGTVLKNATVGSKQIIYAEANNTKANGDMFTIDFTIDEAAEPGDYPITLTVSDMYDADAPAGSSGDVPYVISAGKITIPDTAREYTAAMGADIRSDLGATALVPVTISGEGYGHKYYTNYSMEFEYDSSVLTFDRSKCLGLSDNADVEVNGNQIIVRDYGAARDFSAPSLTLGFTTTGTGDGSVTLKSASVGNEGSASNANEEAAKLTEPDTIVKVNSYIVNLPDDLTGDGSITPGQDYIFSVKDLHYDYTITAKIDDSIIPFTEVSEGTYKIESSKLTGNLRVTSSKAPRQYSAGLSGSAVGDIDAPETAVYLTDYSFTVNKDAAYFYDIGVTVGGVSVNPSVSSGGNVFTIAGADVIGNVSIAVNKILLTSFNAAVNFTGSGACDVVGGVSQMSAIGQDFRFMLNRDDAFKYVVTIGSKIMVPNNQDHYIIAASDVSPGTITVNIDKVAKSLLAINISEYAKVDGQTIYLVVATGHLSDGFVWSYDRNPMYWSEKYGGSAWLIISNKSLAEEQAQARKRIGKTNANNIAVAYDGDANNTGVIDTNDAQFVYNIFNAKYNAISDDVSVLKLLKADVNGDKKVDVNDAAAVINNVKNAR